MYTKLKRPIGNCIDCGKEIELRGNRKRCVRCGIKEQHRLTTLANRLKSLALLKKKSKEVNSFI